MDRPDQIYPSGYRPYPEGTEGTKLQYQLLSAELNVASFQLSKRRVDIILVAITNLASPFFYNLDSNPQVSLVELGGRGIWVTGVIGAIFCIPAILKSAHKIKTLRERINQLDLDI